MEPDYQEGMKKVPTGIPGFDLISLGGLPAGTNTLISGTAGSAKTLFATQFMAEGIRRSNQSGVFVTFEEPPEAIRRNVKGLGWDIGQWEADGKWIFVDASPRHDWESIEAGRFDLGALLARVEHAVRQVGAERVSIDAISAIFSQFSDRATIRRELFKVTAALKEVGLTTVLTAERTDEHGEIARFGVEEFVADNVVILRNSMESGRRRRTAEVLKIRGANHQNGEYPFTVVANQGIVIIPLSEIALQNRASTTRITSGNAELDKMCGGGFFKDSIILVSGATGIGKTLVTTEFIKGGAQSGDRSLLFSFEESEDQLARNALAWGVDLKQLKKTGVLKVVCDYPEVMALEDHLMRMKNTIAEFAPRRVVVDSLSVLERVSSPKAIREFLIALTSFIKHREIAGMVTTTNAGLMAGFSNTEDSFSTATDAIILLRYVEMSGKLRRGLTVLKIRGSRHARDIREFVIDDKGMHIGEPFREVTGILGGAQPCLATSETEGVGAVSRP